MPIELLSGVEETLKALKEQGRYRLVVATKGDLLDQERKLHRSGLTSYFDHIEIMSDKTEKEYTRLLQILQVAPEEFMMIGNSLKSDIQPVLAIGGYGVHIRSSQIETDEKSGGTDGLALMMQVKYSHLFALSDIYSVFCVT